MVDCSVGCWGTGRRCLPSSTTVDHTLTHWPPPSSSCEAGIAVPTCPVCSSRLKGASSFRSSLITKALGPPSSSPAHVGMGQCGSGVGRIAVVGWVAAGQAVDGCLRRGASDTQHAAATLHDSPTSRSTRLQPAALRAPSLSAPLAAPTACWAARICAARSSSSRMCFLRRSYFLYPTNMPVEVVKGGGRGGSSLGFVNGLCHTTKTQHPVSAATAHAAHAPRPHDRRVACASHQASRQPRPAQRSPSWSTSPPRCMRLPRYLSRLASRWSASPAT